MKKVESNINDIENLLRESFENKEANALKEKWATDLDEIHGVKKSNSNRKRKLFYFSMFIILLISLLSFMFFYSNSTQSKQNNIKQIIASTELVSNPEYEFRDEWIKKTISFQAYLELKNKRYIQAIELYKTLEQEGQLELRDRYNLGFALIRTNKANESIEYFKDIINANDIMVEETEWLLAISYLKNGDQNSAQKLLNKIVSLKQYKSLQAKEILESLK